MCAALFSIPVAAENDINLENISATKSEVTLDYSAAVSDNGNIGLTNLVYNFCRYTILKRKEMYMG